MSKWQLNDTSNPFLEVPVHGPLFVNPAIGCQFALSDCHPKRAVLAFMAHRFDKQRASKVGKWLL
jgi:hypothetical protein